MKYLEDRQELAHAIHFEKHPVIAIDIKNRNDYGYFGGKVRIDTGRDFYTDAVIYIFSDKKKLTTAAFGICISETMTYNDYIEMIEYANSPIIKPDEDVIVAIYDSIKQRAFKPFMIHTNKHVDILSSTPLTFEEHDLDWMFPTNTKED